MDSPNIREERIERLLKELEYEVVRGIMEREIDESLGFTFIVPISNSIKDGQVFCEFTTRPVTRGQFFPGHENAKLTVVKP